MILLNKELNYGLVFEILFVKGFLVGFSFGNGFVLNLGFITLFWWNHKAIDYENTYAAHS